MILIPHIFSVLCDNRHLLAAPTPLIATVIFTVRCGNENVGGQSKLDGWTSTLDGRSAHTESLHIRRLFSSTVRCHFERPSNFHPPRIQRPPQSGPHPQLEQFAWHPAPIGLPHSGQFCRSRNASLRCNRLASIWPVRIRWMPVSSTRYTYNSGLTAVAALCQRASIALRQSPGNGGCGAW
jgi:hypothetical protein